MEVYYIDDFVQLSSQLPMPKNCITSHEEHHQSFTAFTPFSRQQRRSPDTTARTQSPKRSWSRAMDCGQYTRRFLDGYSMGGGGELPATQEKVDKLTAEIHRVTGNQAIPCRQFEQIRGKLRPACVHWNPSGQRTDGSHRCQAAR
jgi:hypothetical protein